MPGHRSGSQCVAVAKSGITRAVMCDMDLGTVWKVGPEWEDDQWAKVVAKLNDGGDWQVFEVLRAESNDFALSYKEGKFILCLRRERT